MWLPSVLDSRNSDAWHPQAFADVVQGHVVDLHPKDRWQCKRVATSVGLGKLPDGLGMVAQAPTSYDPCGSGTVGRPGGD